MDPISWKNPTLILFYHFIFLAGIFTVIWANGVDPRSIIGVSVHALLLINLLLCISIFSSVVPYSAISGMGRAIWVIVVFANILLSMEVIARIFPFVTTSEIDPGSRFFNPGLTYPTNNFGFKERDFYEYRAPNVFRTLVFGNSFTEGAGLRREDTFSRITEHYLNDYLQHEGRDFIKAEVYSLAHGGMNAIEEIELALREAERFHPNSIVIVTLLTDVIPHPENFLPGSPTPKWAQKTTQFLLKHIPSYLTYRLYHQITIFGSAPAADNQDLLKFEYGVSSEPWKREQLYLRKLADYCAKHEIDLEMVLFPTLPRTRYPESNKRLHQLLLTAADGMGFRTLDLLPILEASHSKLSDFEFSDYDWHPNPLAARIAGEAIGKSIEKSHKFVQFVRSNSNF